MYTLRVPVPQARLHLGLNQNKCDTIVPTSAYGDEVMNGMFHSGANL